MPSARDELAATSQLPGVLECRYAMRVLWALCNGHPQTFRLLHASVGGITPNTLNTWIKDLRGAVLNNFYNGSTSKGTAS